MTARDTGEVSDPVWRKQLKPGDFVIGIQSNGCDEPELTYAVLVKRIDDFLDDTVDPRRQDWHTVQVVGVEEPSTIIAPMHAFAAQLTAVEARKLEAAGWPKTLQGLLDSLARA